MNEIENRLVDMLTDICDNYDFVYGILGQMKNDYDCEIMIEYINRGIDVNMEQICLLAIDIYESENLVLD